ncbi:MAG TPA: preprotein translocase subunit SecG [Chthoniobacterales bacterium]|nr:preprotein translocase subunit SecG [Chthoniobacterales bacterium]
MSLLINILLGIYVFVALLMMLVILMQRPKSEGLGAAFGGGVTENIFGAQTTNVLTKVTGWLAAIFFLVTFILSILYARKASTQSNLSRELAKGQTPVPVASATPLPSASISPAPATTGSLTPGPNASMPAAAPSTATNSAPVMTSPAPSAAMSVAPATTSPTSPNARVAPSISPSPK